MQGKIMLSFTKWRSRNFVWFVVFPSFPLTYMQKNFLRGAGEFKKVCLSVCLCACASPQQSQITFDILVGWQPNFQGLLNFSQVIFGLVTRTRGPQGQARTPKMGVPAKSIYSGGFGAGGWCDNFSELGRWPKQNVGSRILSFGPWPKKTGPEGRAGQGTTKILEFQHFS